MAFAVRKVLSGLLCIGCKWSAIVLVLQCRVSSRVPSAAIVSTEVQKNIFLPYPIPRGSFHNLDIGIIYKSNLIFASGTHYRF